MSCRESSRTGRSFSTTPPGTEHDGIKQHDADLQSSMSIPIEILEMILVHVDMKTLLISASRVSKRWASVIAESPRIQQALFFLPVEAPFSTKTESVMNPILVEKFGDVFFELQGGQIHDRRVDSFLRLPWAPRKLLLVNTLYRRSPKIELDEFQKAFTRKGASWRRMLTSQPPSPFLGLLTFSTPMPLAQAVHTATIQPIRPSLGLQMGQIYDTALRYLGEPGDLSMLFKIVWNEARGQRATHTCKRACSELLTTTNVVLAVRDASVIEVWYQGPFPLASYINAFACEERLCVDAGDLTRVLPPSPEAVYLDTENMVFWSEPIID